MTGRSKRKGDDFEREVAVMFADELGVPARRAFGAGRGHDEGDIVGVPNTIVQATNTQSRFYEAVRLKPVQAELQRLNAHADFAVTVVRLTGGGDNKRMVMTPDQWFTLYRAAL